MHLPLHVISQHAGLIFQHLVDKTVFKPRQVALLIPTETKKNELLTPTSTAC